MKEVYDLLRPEKIIKSDNVELTQRERAEILFDAVGKEAAHCVALGCVALAELVESAWKEGDGDGVLNQLEIETYSETDLKNLYYSPQFLPALTFDKLAKMGY